MKYELFIVILFFTVLASASAKDSTEYKVHEGKFLIKQVIPLTLISTGALLNIGDVKYNIQDKIPITNNGLDDYFQYSPMFQMYTYNMLGFKHRNSVFDQTKYLIISQLISSTIVHTLKSTTKVERPNGGNKSFPSGHTTNAFVGATMLFHEFKDTNRPLAYSGYIFATATGILRVTNNAHWLSDVIAGAGIGILTVNLVYYFEPLKNWQPFKSKNKELAFTPLISTNSLGLHIRF